MKQLLGMGLFRGQLGGTAALFQEKQEESERAERRSRTPFCVPER